jgi:hypothetical protein
VFGGAIAGTRIPILLITFRPAAAEHQSQPETEGYDESQDVLFSFHFAPFESSLNPIKRSGACRTAFELAVFYSRDALQRAILGEIVHQVFILVDGFFLRRAARGFAPPRFKPDAVVCIELRIGVETVIVTSESLGIFSVSIFPPAGVSLAFISDLSSAARIFRGGG